MDDGQPKSFRFSLQQLLLYVVAICVGFGSYARAEHLFGWEIGAFFCLSSAFIVVLLQRAFFQPLQWIQIKRVVSVGVAVWSFSFLLMPTWFGQNVRDRMEFHESYRHSQIVMTKIVRTNPCFSQVSWTVNKKRRIEVTVTGSVRSVGLAQSLHFALRQNLRPKVKIGYQLLVEETQCEFEPQKHECIYRNKRKPR